MLKFALGILAAIFALGGTAFAQTCSSYPYTLTNGQTADASQLMANFNCVALTNSPTFTGWVGIGAAIPGYPLAISSATVVTLRLNGTSGIPTSNNTQLRFAGGKSGEMWAVGTDIIAINGSTDFYLYDMSHGPTLTLQGGTGDVGIGTTAPTAMLQIEGVGSCPSGLRTAYVSNGGNSFDILQGTDNNLYFCYAGGSVASIGTTGVYRQISDGRLKTNIGALQDDNGLAAIMKLRPVAYSFKRDRAAAKHLGFIAQEVQRVFPELVETMALPAANGTEKDQVSDAKGLDYTGLIAPLVKAV